MFQNSSGTELARINVSASSLYFGNAAGGSSAAGVNNTGIGASALGSVSTGTGNTTLGSGALASVSGNNNNTAIGYNAGNLATGGNNIFVGALAGDNVTTGTDNIIIGYNLDASAAGVTNELRIGGVLQGNTSTLAAQFNGALTLIGNFTQTGATTFSTGTGAVSLNGDTTISSGKNLTITSGTTSLTGALTVATGYTFTNASSTLLVTTAVADKPTGGAIGTAAATVDVATAFDVNQTTAGQALTLPAPTNTASGRIVYINNIGSTSISMYGVTIANGNSAGYTWNGTAWTVISGGGAGGSGVTTVGAFSGSSQTNGANITGTTITFGPADGTNPGMVTTGVQTLAGAKTFSSLLQGTAGITVSGNATLAATAGNTFSAGNTTGAVTLTHHSTRQWL